MYTPSTQQNSGCHFLLQIKNYTPGLLYFENVNLTCSTFKGVQPLRVYCTSYQKLGCFVLFLKIYVINNFLNNELWILKKKFKELKNGTEILVGQAVFKVTDRNIQNVFLDQ